jgi:hypothetical protein
MQRGAAWWVLGLSVGLASRANDAGAGSAAPAPVQLPGQPALAQADAGPRRFVFLDAPPPTPPPLPPDPAGEPDEHPRRTWELLPQVGAGTPFCRGNALGPGSCTAAGAGAAFGVGALYRLSPYVALGVDLNVASFRLDGSLANRAYSQTNWFGLLVRGYFAEHGLLDPYVEMGLGRGAAESGDADLRVTSAGPSTMAGAGVDFWVLPYLRIGPAASYRWTWLSSVDICSAGRCATASVADGGAVGSYATLSFVATLALGQEM